MIDNDDGHESVPRLTPPSIYRSDSIIIINNKKKNKSHQRQLIKYIYAIALVSFRWTKSKGFFIFKTSGLIPYHRPALIPRPHQTAPIAVVDGTVGDINKIEEEAKKKEKKHKPK